MREERPDLSSDRIDEAVLQALIKQPTIEVAVVADGAAKRDVNVHPRDWGVAIRD
jgi:hypothetical protein